MRRHGRLVGGVYAAAAGVLIIAVLAVAYGTAAPSLGIAEFAPSANRTVEPPPTTAGNDAVAASARSRASTTTTAAPTPSATDPGATAPAAPTTRAARTRACVGNPPRQTEDPMSPACLAAIYEGDNGGATSTGVSSTEVRIAVPAPSGFGTAGANFKAGVDALFEHFNRRYELYGRRLVPVLVQGGAADAVAARALGTNVAAQGVFGTVTGYLESEAANHLTAVQTGFLQELARQRVVAVTRNAGAGWSDRQLFDSFHPYIWSSFPSSESNQTHMAEVLCKSLVGHPAKHARQANLREQTRRFAVVALGQLTTPSATTVIDALTACDRAPLTFQFGGGNTGSEIRTGLERLRADGATTIVCICEGLLSYFSAVPTAVGLGYDPEWVVLPSPLVTDEAVPQYAGYGANYLRVDPGPRLLPLQSRPWFGALLESGSQLMQTSKKSQQAGFYVGQTLYEGLLVLAAGIQGAGPTLTPDTFAAALMGTAFPNPGAGAAPYWQPSAGFGPGDHSFYDDYALAWWSQTALAVEPYSPNAQGSWCYLGAGARFQLGSYSNDADSRFYSETEPCR